MKRYLLGFLVDLSLGFEGKLENNGILGSVAQSIMTLIFQQSLFRDYVRKYMYGLSTGNAGYYVWLIASKIMQNEIRNLLPVDQI